MTLPDDKPAIVGADANDLCDVAEHICAAVLVVPIE
jgi:hypothetical protein